MPVPLALPNEPDPAIVVTTPSVSIFRMRLLNKSALIIFPALSIVTPKGPLKLASVPIPLAFPAEPVPAIVVTTPELF